MSDDVMYTENFSTKNSFSSQNLFLLSILQHVIAYKSNHINTMLPNEMVLTPLQKLKIKYELSYQSTTRLTRSDRRGWKGCAHAQPLIAQRTLLYYENQ
jgi:hypothetical protein